MSGYNLDDLAVSIEVQQVGGSVDLIAGGLENIAKQAEQAERRVQLMNTALTKLDPEKAAELSTKFVNMSDVFESAVVSLDKLGETKSLSTLSAAINDALGNAHAFRDGLLSLDKVEIGQRLWNHLKNDSNEAFTAVFQDADKAFGNIVDSMSKNFGDADDLQKWSGAAQTHIQQFEQAAKQTWQEVFGGDLLTTFGDKGEQAVGRIRTAVAGLETTFSKLKTSLSSAIAIANEQDERWYKARIARDTALAEIVERERLGTVTPEQANNRRAVVEKTWQSSKGSDPEEFAEMQREKAYQAALEQDRKDEQASEARQKQWVEEAETRSRLQRESELADTRNALIPQLEERDRQKELQEQERVNAEVQRLSERGNRLKELTETLLPVIEKDEAQQKRAVAQKAIEQAAAREIKQIQTAIQAYKEKYAELKRLKTEMETQQPGSFQTAVKVAKEQFDVDSGRKKNREDIEQYNKLLLQKEQLDKDYAKNVGRIYEDMRKDKSVEAHKQNLRRLADLEEAHIRALTSRYEQLNKLRSGLQTPNAVTQLAGTPQTDVEKLGVGAANSALGATYTTTKQAADALGTSVEKLEKKIKADKKTQKEKADVNTLLSQTFNTVNNAVHALSMGMGGLTTAFANFHLGTAIKDAVILASRVENLGTVVRHLGMVNGYSAGSINLLESQIEKLGITTQSARESLALLVQGELDLADAGKLARIAQDSAVIAGINSSEAYEKLVVAIQRTNGWMLRNLGIMINLNAVYRDFAISNGRTLNTLDSHEKQQLVLNKVIERGAIVQGVYEAALADTHKQYTSMARFVEQAQVEFGEQFSEMFGWVVRTTTEGLKLFIAAEDWVKETTAGVAAATTVMLGLAAAVGILAGAFIALQAASGSIIAVLALIGAGVASLITYNFVAASAAVANFKRAIQDARNEGKEQVVQAQQLRDIYLDLAALADPGMVRTLDHAKQIRDLIYDTAVLLKPEERSELFALGDDPDAIKEYIKSKNPEAAKTQKELLLDVLQAEMDLEQQKQDFNADARRRFAEFRRPEDVLETLIMLSGESRTLDTDPGYNKPDFDYYNDAASGTPQGYDALSTQNAKALRDRAKSIAAQEAELQGTREQMSLIPTEQKAQLYGKQEKALEISHNLALRIINQFNDDRLESWKGTGYEIFEDYSKMMDNLGATSKGFVTMEENALAAQQLRTDGLKEARDLSLEELRTEQERQLVGADEQEQAAINAEFEAKRNTVNRETTSAIKVITDQTAETLKAQRGDLDQIIEAEQLILKITSQRLEKLTLENDLLEKQNKLLDEGIDAEVVKTQLAAERETKQQADRSKLFEEAQQKLEKDIAERQEKIRALKAMPQTPDRNQEIISQQAVLDAKEATLQQSYEVEEEALRQHELKMAQIGKDSLQARTEEIKKINDEILSLEQQLFDSKEKLLKHEEQMAKTAHENKLKQMEDELNKELEVLAIEESANKEKTKRFMENFELKKKIIEADREYGKLVAQGWSTQAARAMVREKMGILPIGVQQFQAGQEQQLKDIQKQREDAEARKRQIAAERELEHQKRVEDDAAIAEEARLKMIHELEEISGKLGDAEKKADEVKGVDKLKAELHLAIDDALKAGKPALARALDRKLKEVEGQPGNLPKGADLGNRPVGAPAKDDPRVVAEPPRKPRTQEEVTAEQRNKLLKDFNTAQEQWSDAQIAADEDPENTDKQTKAKNALKRRNDLDKRIEQLDNQGKKRADEAVGNPFMEEQQKIKDEWDAIGKELDELAPPENPVESVVDPFVEEQQKINDMWKGMGGKDFEEQNRIQQENERIQRENELDLGVMSDPAAIGRFPELFAGLGKQLGNSLNPTNLLNNLPSLSQITSMDFSGLLDALTGSTGDVVGGIDKQNGEIEQLASAVTKGLDKVSSGVLKTTSTVVDMRENIESQVKEFDSQFSNYGIT